MDARLLPAFTYDQLIDGNKMEFLFKSIQFDNNQGMRVYTTNSYLKKAEISYLKLYGYQVKADQHSAFIFW